MQRVRIQGHHLQLTESREQDRAAGGLVDPAALHPDLPGLHHVHPAHAIGGPQPVQELHQLHGRQPLAVDSHGDTLLELHFDVRLSIRGVLGGLGALEHLFLRAVPGIFEISALVAEVPQVAVPGVDALLRDLAQVDVVNPGVVDGFLPRADVPQPPGGDDLEVGRQGLVGQLEAHLVVALSGAAVSHGVGALLEGDLDLVPGLQGPGDRGTQQVLVLVDGPRPQQREQVVPDELLPHVEQVELGGSRGEGLGLEAAQLFVLPDVGAHGHHLRSRVVLLEPGDDDRGVETSRVGEYDFLDRMFGHSCSSSSMSDAALRARPPGDRGDLLENSSQN